MIIRRVHVAEASLLHALRLEVDGKSSGPLGHPLQRQLATQEGEIKQQLADLGSFTVGAFMDDRLVGAASIAPTLSLPNWFGLFAVAVSGEFRGCRLGRPLVTGCLAYAGSKNAEGVTLEVNVPNPVAKALYDSLGFEVWNISERAYSYEGIQYDQLSMRKRLGGA